LSLNPCDYILLHPLVFSQQRLSLVGIIWNALDSCGGTSSGLLFWKVNYCAGGRLHFDNLTFALRHTVFHIYFSSTSTSFLNLHQLNNLRYHSSLEQLSATTGKMASSLSMNEVSLKSSPPPKRQKTGGRFTSASNSPSTTHAYNSEADSGDELFEGFFIPDTPAGAGGKYETQPTQIIDRSAPKASCTSSPPETPLRNEVQVPASSPLTGKVAQPAKPASSGTQRPIQNGSAGQKRNLAMSMAPAGTAYKPPNGIIRKPAPTFITIDDDDEDDEVQLIESDTSEDGLSAQADIKPTIFKSKSAQSSFNSSNLSQQSNGNARFQSIVSNAAYKGPGMGSSSSAYGHQGWNSASTSLSMSGASKPISSDSMSLGYGTHKKPLTQMKPQRAMPIEDMPLESLNDAVLREKVTRLRAIYPSTTVLMCRNALIKAQGSLNDAANILGCESYDTDTDEIESPRAPVTKMAQPYMMKKPEPQMKRTIDAPLASLKDRYSSTQAEKPAVATPPPKPKKKLVQGRRHLSSPATPAVSSPLKPMPSSPVVSLNEYDSDSGVASATEEEDPELEERVLKFLNRCSIEELVELTSTTKPYATIMTEARPFKNLDVAREVQNTTTTKSGKKSTRAPIGDRIVQTALNMFTGYEAIDSLVKRCEELGKPLFEEMNKWGFDVFGAAKGGELEMTSFEDDNASQRDSGIGSPSSGPASLNGDADDDIKALSSTRKKNVTFIKQPGTMSTDVSLKDYQVVGLNWLALMYRQKLSGILADEMGLGKTAQVIALLSHLVETGHSGPHLVICPGSTLENWLREIPRFAPDLVVDVYYGMFSTFLWIALESDYF
jgi:SWI/SNF-related matrix-associated actin-dependent regulator 1 of chromatin subfamily A